MLVHASPVVQSGSAQHSIVPQTLPHLCTSQTITVDQPRVFTESCMHFYFPIGSAFLSLLGTPPHKLIAQPDLLFFLSRAAVWLPSGAPQPAAPRALTQPVQISLALRVSMENKRHPWLQSFSHTQSTT